MNPCTVRPALAGSVEAVTRSTVSTGSAAIAARYSRFPVVNSSSLLHSSHAPQNKRPFEFRAQSKQFSTVSAESIPGTKVDRNLMVLVYTCGECDHREARKISKNAYTNGIVVVKCSNCGNRHLIADHLNWISSEKTDVEVMVREKGGNVINCLSPSRAKDSSDSSATTSSGSSSSTSSASGGGTSAIPVLVVGGDSGNATMTTSNAYAELAIPAMSETENTLVSVHKSLSLSAGNGVNVVPPNVLQTYISDGLIHIEGDISSKELAKLQEPK